MYFFIFRHFLIDLFPNFLISAFTYLILYLFIIDLWIFKWFCPSSPPRFPWLVKCLQWVRLFSPELVKDWQLRESQQDVRWLKSYRLVCLETRWQLFHSGCSFLPAADEQIRSDPQHLQPQTLTSPSRRVSECANQTAVDVSYETARRRRRRHERWKTWHVMKC